MADIDASGVPQPPDMPDFQDRVARARAAGLSWDDISAAAVQMRDEAKAQGQTDPAIDKTMGLKNPAPAQKTLEKASQEHSDAWVKANTPEGEQPAQEPAKDMWSGFLAGLERSAGGLTSTGSLPKTIEPEDAGYATHLAAQAGELLGDIPAMIAGAVGGTVVGTAVAPGPGTLVGGGAGAMALPAYIKSTYMDGLLHGHFKDPTDFATRQASIWWNTAKAATTGASIPLAAEMAGAKLAQAGAGPIATFVGQKSAELAAMTTVSKALEGQLPNPRDLMDAAVMLGGMHLATGVAPKIVATARENLGWNWVRTGEPPLQAAQRAVQDPVFRAQMTAPMHPDATPDAEGNVAAGPDSSATQTDDGPFIISKAELSGFQGEPILTFHGSHAYFDEFSNEKIGSGEGTQFESFGHYSTERYEAAKFYRDQGIRLHGPQLDPLGAAKEALVAFGGDITRARASLTNDSLDTTIEPELRQKAKDAIGQLENAKGFIYNLKINRAKEDFIDWDKPLSEQSDKIQGFAKSILGDTADMGITGQQFYRKYKALNNEQPNVSSQGFTQKAVEAKVAGMQYYGAFEGHRNYVTYDPADIEIEHAEPGEATGAYEGDPMAAVAAHIAQPSVGPSLWQRFKEAVPKVYQELFNADHPLRKLQTAIEKGRALSDANNPNFLRRIADLSSSRAQYMIKGGMIDIDGNYMGPSLDAILGRFKGAQEETNFWAYAYSRWAVEKAVQNKETGVEVDAAIANVRNEENVRKYENTFHDLMEWQNGTLKYARDGGLISEETYQKIVSDNKSRVPGYRWQDEGENAPKGSGPGKTAYNPVKTFFGSTKQVKDAYTSLMQDAFLRVELANRNRATQSLMDAAQSVGLAGTEGTGHPVKFSLSHDEMMKLGIGDENPDAAIWRMVGKDIRNDQVPVLRDGKLEAWNVDPDFADTIPVLRGYDKATLAVWKQWTLVPFARLQRTLVVLNPLFPIRLAAYDMPFQFIAKPGFRNTLADFYTGLKHTWGDGSPQYDAWMRSGGAERIFEGLNKNDFMKQQLTGRGDEGIAAQIWNKTNPVSVLRSWAQYLNQAQRVGRYVRGQDAGETGIRSAVASSEAAFHRAGYGGNEGKVLNMMQPFFLAHMNNLEQTARGMFGVGKTITGEDYSTTKQIVTFSAKAAALITVPMLAQWVQNRDKEWYKAAPDWQKDNCLLFNIGSEESPTIVPLPLPPLLSMIYGGIPRRLMDGFIGNNPEASKNLLTSAAASLMPPGGLIGASAITPIIEHLTNHSFPRDQPLIPDHLKGNFAPEQFTNYSSSAGKFLSQMINDMPLMHDAKNPLSPIVIDNYIKGWGGTIAPAITKAWDLYKNGQNPDMPAASISDWPFMGSWTERYPSANAKPIADFMQRMDNYQMVHGSLMTAFQNNDLSRAQQLVSDNPAAAVLHKFSPSVNNASMTPETQAAMGPMINNAAQSLDQADAIAALNASKVLTGMRKYVKLVYDHETPDVRQAIGQLQHDLMGIPPSAGTGPQGSMTKLDKRQLIDQAYGWMQVIAEQGLSAMDKAGMK